MDDKNWSLVFTTSNPIEAEIVKQMLESNGIEAVVLNKHDSAYQTFGEAEVYVFAGSEVVALKLIKGLEI
jgi:phosphoribosylpyrophosphate synthetase